MKRLYSKDQAKVKLVLKFKNWMRNLNIPKFKSINCQKQYKSHQKLRKKKIFKLPKVK